MRATARSTWSRKRIVASAMVFLWLASTWAAAANWCCDVPTSRTEFPNDATSAHHEPAEYATDHAGHDHPAKVTEETTPQPADSESCAEIAPVDKGLRWGGFALAQPSAGEIVYAPAPAPRSNGILKRDAFGRWIPPPPVYQASPFLSTIRLLL
ncbi:MAG: hypothetical protein ACKVQA_26015 [Burkholderiales bacterium]